MSNDLRTALDVAAGGSGREPGQAAAARGRRPLGVPLSKDTALALEMRELVERDDLERARDLFAGLVEAHQRRATRIAYQYLRDASEADEAVQDAFVKVFSHIRSYREAWPFEVWFTRILINGCLDRRKARARRERWLVPAGDTGVPDDSRNPTLGVSADAGPEARLLSRERRARLAAAIDRLDGRQRTVFMLCHYGDHTPREVSAMTGLNESTVRVHLFRAARKLRSVLGAQP
jgi:RNA polymerase sigma-70 factor, ECF subfamily